MKIARLETIPLAIPYEHGGPKASWGGQSWNRLNILLVRLEDEAGRVGWGEAFSYNCIAAVKAFIDHSIAPVVVGREVSSIPAFMREMHQGLHLFGRSGVTIFALSGLDIGLWDLAAKRADVSLSAMLGASAENTKLAGYASLLKYRDPELVGEYARRALDMGFTTLKLHETGYDEVAAAREAAGDGVPVCVDVNCPWTPIEARENALTLKPLDLHWLEEPIFPPEDFRSLGRLQAETGIPLAAGENISGAFQFQQMIDHNAVRYVQPSVTKVGGISEFRKVVALAETQDATVMPHSPYFGPGWLATLHLVAAMPNPGSLVECFFTEVEATLYDGYIKPDAKGDFSLPGGVGLGIEPDPDVMRDYRLEL